VCELPRADDACPDQFGPPGFGHTNVRMLQLRQRRHVSELSAGTLSLRARMLRKMAIALITFAAVVLDPLWLRVESWWQYLCVRAWLGDLAVLYGPSAAVADRRLSPRKFDREVARDLGMDAAPDDRQPCGGRDGAYIRLSRPDHAADAAGEGGGGESYPGSRIS
jgi:hypothetical protein